MPRNAERRVSNRVRPDADVPLLDERHRLHPSFASAIILLSSSTKATHRADGLRHLRRAHHDGEPPPAERGDGELVLDVAELGGGVEDAEVVELGEELGFCACAEGVRGREEGEAVGEGAERAAEFVVSSKGRWVSVDGEVR